MVRGGRGGGVLPEKLGLGAVLSGFQNPCPRVVSSRANIPSERPEYKNHNLSETSKLAKMDTLFLNKKG